MGWIKRWKAQSEFKNLLRKAQASGKNRFLVLWNRGLGDIPLGLYGLVRKIRAHIPTAKIQVITRTDLEAGFKLLDHIEVVSCPSWKRGHSSNLEETLQQTGLSRDSFDLVLDNPDLTSWLRKDQGKYIPTLRWDDKLDALAEAFSIDQSKKIIAVHVQTETHYNYEKNWPVHRFNELFSTLAEAGGFQIILFGFYKSEEYNFPNVLDLRGKTTLYDMLSIIKNKVDYLLAPDSGVLCMSYYLNAVFPLRIVSLWADPRQGILRLKVPSPNPKLESVYLIGKKKNPERIPVDAVMHALFQPREEVLCRQIF